MIKKKLMIKNIIEVVLYDIYIHTYVADIINNGNRC